MITGDFILWYYDFCPLHIVKSGNHFENGHFKCSSFSGIYMYVKILRSAIAIGTVFCYALFLLRIFHPSGDIAGEGLQIWIYGLLAIEQRWFFIMSALTICVTQDLYFKVSSAKTWFSLNPAPPPPSPSLPRLQTRVPSNMTRVRHEYGW